MILSKQYRHSAQPKSIEPSVISGQNWGLRVIKSPKDGPWYPHFAEELTADRFRLFAGRIAGLTPSDTLPKEHAVANDPVDMWTFRDHDPDGSWIALKFDRERDILSITSDLFLIQRWYYTCQNGDWYFSNSLIFLHSILKSQLEIEERSIPYMLQFGYLPLQYTPLKDVFQLRTGYFLVIENGQSRLGFRSQIPVRYRYPHISGNIPQAIHTSLLEATTRELNTLENVIIPISGGLDSRYLLGCALQVMQPEQITTMTFGLPSSLDFQIGTRIARSLGLNNLALPKDKRSISELLPENFRNAEGMYWCYPDYPVGPMKSALPEHSYVLSGYIGFRTGSWFFKPGQVAEGSIQQELVKYLLGSFEFISPEMVKLLLSDGNVDPVGLVNQAAPLPDRDLQENWEYWQYENYLLNRNNGALQLFRDRAFYMAPFMHHGALDISYAIPTGNLLCTKYFIEALAQFFPELSRIPTTRNFGFAPGIPKNLRINAARSWRKMRSLIDDLIGAPLGLQLYQHPRNNYTHTRELYRKENRDFVVGCLEDLRKVSAFSLAGLNKVRDDYLHNRQPNPYLLRGLITIQQWLVHYRKS